MHKAISITMILLSLIIGNKLKDVTLFADYECSKTNEYEQAYSYYDYYDQYVAEKLNCKGHGEHGEGIIHWNINRIFFYIVSLIIILGYNLHIRLERDKLNEHHRPFYERDDIF